MPFFAPNKVPIKDRPILFIDLEMTGLNFDTHEIIEIAALKVAQPQFEIVNSFYSKVMPQKLETADPNALKVIGFNKDIWEKDAISLRHALVELGEFAGGNCILAGFSVQNEWDFLLKALQKESLPIFFSNYLLEVWTLVYKKYYNDPSITNLGMSNLCKFMGISVDRHKPDSDIQATYEIFKKLI